MLLSLLLIGRMLLARPDEGPPADNTGSSQEQTQPQTQPETPTEPEETQGIQLTENDLCTLIVQALSFTPDRIDAQISRDSTVSISATVKRQTILDSGIVSGGLRTALMFMPDECGMQGSWEVSLNDGEVVLDNGRVEIAGISLPGQALEAATGQIAEGINQIIRGWDVNPTELGFEDGAITIK